MGTQQIYIDCNRANTDDKDNEDQTNMWTYHLNKELLLPAGSQISVSNVFLNQKGINGQSIEIERDYEERMNFYVYVTDDLHPYPIPDNEDGGMYGNVLRNVNYVDMFGTLQVENTANHIGYGLEHGGSSSLLVCYEPFEEEGILRIKPVLKSKNIKIKKGTYGINQLNDIINSQINGTRSIEGKSQHPFADSITSETFKGNLCESLAGLTHIITPYPRFTIAGPDPAPLMGLTSGHVFLSIDDHLDNLAAVKGTNNIPRLTWLDWVNANRYYSVLTDNQDNADENIQNYQIGYKKYAIGTTMFKMDYSSDLNGFSINYLHQPYRIPSHDAQKNKNLDEGEEAILLRSCTTDDLITTNETVEVVEKIKSTLNRPVTRSSGALVHNFSVAKSIEYSNRPEGYISNSYDTFAQIVNNDKKAKKAWSETLWFRLGFSYSQLNDPSKFETNKIYNKILNNNNIGGVTTDQDIDISIYSQLSCKQSPFDHAVLGGGKSGVYSPYNFIPSNTPKVGVITVSTDSNNTKSYNGSPYVSSTSINVLTGGRPIVADNLPSLSIHGYYIVTSDIIPQYDDLIKGGPLPLLATVPKSNLSNQDFISSSNDITHILSNPIVLNKIQIAILNPDLTAPQLSDNSSVLIRLEIPIE